MFFLQTSKVKMLLYSTAVKSDAFLTLVLKGERQCMDDNCVQSFYTSKLFFKDFDERYFYICCINIIQKY